jgi:WD40 repeat protein
MTDDAGKPVMPFKASSEVPFETPSPASSDSERPEIYGITKGKDGIALNRRSFLGVATATGTLAACTPLLGNKNAASPKKPGSGEAHNSRIVGLALRDESLFSWDEVSLKAWDVAKGNLKNTVSRSRLAEEFKQAEATFPDLFRNIWLASKVAFGVNGEPMAGYGDDGITLWETVQGKATKSKTLKENPERISVLAFHPDGTKLAAGDLDGAITVWDLKSGKAQGFRSVKNTVCSLAFHPMEPVLLSGHSDGKVREWRLSDGKAGKTLSWHDKPVQCLEITPDGKLAVTGSDDRTLKFWSLPDGKLEVSLDVPLQETTCAMDIAANGQILAAGTHQGRIYLWRMPEGELLGCLFDPALLDQGTSMARYRQMGNRTHIQPCHEPLPPGATCVCDCVAANRTSYFTTQQICTCDTIAVPAGYAGPGVCICNTILVGTSTRPASAAPRPAGCSCVGNVSRGGSHYWRPN